MKRRGRKIGEKRGERGGGVRRERVRRRFPCREGGETDFKE